MGEENACSLLVAGRRLMEEGDPARAAAVLERARAMEPGKGSILEALGRARYQSGRYGEALESFDEALDVDPANDYAHYCAGLCCLKLGRKDKAAGHFKVAWYLKPIDEYRAMAHRFGVAVAPGPDRED